MHLSVGGMHEQFDFVYFQSIISNRNKLLRKMSNAKTEEEEGGKDFPIHLS